MFIKFASSETKNLGCKRLSHRKRGCETPLAKIKQHTDSATDFKFFIIKYARVDGTEKQTCDHLVNEQAM